MHFLHIIPSFTSFAYLRKTCLFVHKKTTFKKQKINKRRYSHLAGTAHMYKSSYYNLTKNVSIKISNDTYA